MRKALLAGISALGLFAVQASAVTLTFDGTNAAGLEAANYGDVGGVVNFTWSDDSAPGLSTFWVNDNYNDLDNVGILNNNTGANTFTVVIAASVSGETITLVSLDLAEFSGVADTVVTANAYNSGTVNLPDTGHVTVSPNVTAASITLTFTETGGTGTTTAAEDIGIDNLIYTVNPVPEPATLGLVGLAGLAMLRRRR